ncbi:hypothetical protein GGD65_002236 [Bradyrhizobium sp. CIR18]|nr:hypothetical protein [Bradyrhizobium sp. CIR18]
MHIPTCSAVGWAKAHSAVPTISVHERQGVGTLRFAHPTRSGLWHASQIADTPSRSRGAICPSFAWSRDPLIQEGAGKAGCWLAPAVCCALGTRRRTAQQHTGGADHSAFPAQWLDGLCRDLPGADHSFWPPSPRELDDAVCPVGLARTFARLDRSNDGQDHTVLPYARSLVTTLSPGLVDVAERMWRDELNSAAHPHAVSGSQGLPALPAPLVPTLPRPPQTRLATVTTT